MRCLIVGGGPGGLYLAHLLKRNDPRRHVTVCERNGPEDAFGWGVVFPESAVEQLRAHDAITAAELDGAVARWNVLEVRIRGSLVRTTGHSFRGVGRARLLALLRRQCAASGALLSYHTTITDVRSFADYDLVVGADGLNSEIRGAFRDAFRPTLTRCRAKYIWFGTKKRFEHFTVSFRENSAGLFWVFAYPFDGETSTFNIECDERTWARSGLAEADETTQIRYCERLFADDLEGHGLLSNRSVWRNFMVVKNASWHFRNIVLLGDAAHTAHFSVGSGTRLALDDAQALARALETNERVDLAFAAYEVERRPRVEDLQRAASASTGWFQNAHDYAHLPPLQFAGGLLMRSGRISFDSLKRRDPELVDSMCASFTGDALTAGMSEPCDVPLRLRRLVLENRRVLRVARIGESASAEAARSRPGMVVLERGFGGLVEDPRRWVELLDRAGIPRNSHSKLALELGHPEATVEEIVEDASRALNAGVDLLEIAVAGASESACQFRHLLEVVERVRSVWPPDRPLMVRWGTYRDDLEAEVVAVESLRSLVKAGCDLLVIGETHLDEVGAVAEPTPSLGLVVCARIRATAGVPTMAVVQHASRSRSNTMLIAGQCDLCASYYRGAD
jgi:2-polyprenyl-6-methoxyphenol hydroxylase-like FAD-dependent oxidoreductase